MSWREESAVVIERCRGLKGEIQLQKRGSDFEIIYNGVFLMATYNGASEKAAVRKSLHLASRYYHDSLRVLMGGLGVGFSLQEALSQANVSYVAVAEIESKIIRWNREHLTAINNNALFDKRIEIFNGDFRLILEKEAEKTKKLPDQRYHVVMVDTDNGSCWLSLPDNSFFYQEEGLRLINRILYPKGIACFWCSYQETSFERRLKKTFYRVSFNSELEKTGQVGCYYLAQS